MNIQRFILSASKLTPKEYYRMTKAKRAYRKENCKCAICSTDKHLEVHHVIPVHVDPSKAADTHNFITLCDKRNNGCHYVFGHFRNFRSHWNPMIRVFAENAADLLEMCVEKFESISSNTN